MKLRAELHEANRLSWNAATHAHNSHKGDQAAFFRTGGSTLFPEEIALLGDLHGLRLAHLQCNSGQDSLSLANLGATVTGVDISDEAITFARALAVAADHAAIFQCADIYDWFAQETACYDRVFASYGAVCWLSDLHRWAVGIAEKLVPGGRFVLMEFHPIAMYFDEHFQPAYDYFTKDPVCERSGVSDYVALSGQGLTPDGYTPGIRDFRNPHPSYEFYWGIGDVVTALAQAGLVLEQLHEYPYVNGWRPFENMRDLGGRRCALPETTPRLPLMYGLSAGKAPSMP